MQIIIDKSAAIRYMVKYAAKPEKSSQTYIDTFKSILCHSTDEDDPKSKLSPRIRHNPLDTNNHRKFCYYQLIKYSSWDSSNLSEINNYDTAIERFEIFIKLAPERIIYSLNFFNDFLKELKKIREELDPEPEAEMLPTEYTELSELVPISDIVDKDTPIFDLIFDWKLRKKNYSCSQLDLMNNWVENKKKIFNDIDDSKCPLVDKESLNKMQRFAFNIVKTHLQQNIQLLMILIGTAGTGKSFTIFAISNLLENCLKRCAPTAKAAFIIRGETIHSLFNIQLDNEQLSIPQKKLSKLQQDFYLVRFIIIDEYSMLSQKMLGIIDNRLKQIKGNNKIFGGVSVILVGDLGQLLPVCGSPLYCNKANKPLNIDGYKAYNQFKAIVKLEKVERQTNLENNLKQQHFIDFLPRFRN
ncbi:unnamed protein product [Brachionus calyciflorus]|uniref:ATP-dependent DNA helicase n=1 Tax=Brachionus calyciflorus TaxID=104777 RepID=A0A814N5Y6_9BILA|nr:unnamed protein product [Brachionus calyciflorus]